MGAGVIGVVTLGPALSAPDAAAGASSALGAPHPATLAPVTIGYISDGGSGTVGTAPLVEQGARMVVAYQNTYGDGLEGHRIDLYICENDETPAGGQACANDMVQRGVAAVVEPGTRSAASRSTTRRRSSSAARQHLDEQVRGADSGDELFQKCCDTLAPGTAKWYPLFQPQPGGCCGWS